MSSSEKFESSKDGLIKNNEAKYGKEIRRKYGDETVNASNARLKGMTEEKMRQAEDLRKQLEETLAEAYAIGDPAGGLAHKLCELHRQWLCIYWPEGMYSPEAHTGLADMYVEDERFKANYEKIAPGCTEFLRDAIHIYCKQQ